MSKWLLGLIVLLAVVPAYSNFEDAMSQAQTLIAEGRYNEGHNALKQKLRDNTLSSPQRHQLLFALGNFYSEFVGDFDTAAMFYRQIVQSDLPEDHAIKTQTLEKTAEIKAMKAAYLSQDKLLKKYTSQSYRQLEPEQTKTLTSQLQRLARENPDYYKIANVYFFLGLNQEKLENYKASYKAFQTALNKKPAMGLFLPLSRMDVVLEAWRRQQVNGTIWAAAGILLVIIALSYYLSKPWRWMKLRHVWVGLGVLAVWWGVFKISHYWLASQYVVPEVMTAEPADVPEYLQITPGSYGSETAEYLLNYGLVGVAGLYIFILGSSRLKFRPLALCANGIMGLLILSTMTAIFYLRYCDRKSTFISQGQGLRFYAAGNIYLPVPEPEASIFTNPKAFPNPNAHNADAELKEWLLRHCVFDEPQEQEGQAH